mmetsp:Transcript_29774/g.63149  ORF Transcript_29774/g.63149 Transcript_29774/m.63149 type:complete len:244 (-) Transcript_29774:402-1133(-)
MRGQIIRWHFHIRATHSTGAGATAILTTNVPHWKVQSNRPVFQHGHIRTHKRRQRPNIRPRMTLRKLLHQRMNRLNRLLQPLIIGIVQINTPIAPTHTIMETQPQKLWNQFPFAVFDQLGNVRTNIVNVGLVVSIVVPAVGLPSSEGSALGVDFEGCGPRIVVVDVVVFPAVVAPFSRVDGFASRGGAAGLAGFSRARAAAAALAGFARGRAGGGPSAGGAYPCPVSAYVAPIAAVGPFVVTA